MHPCHWFAAILLPAVVSSCTESQKEQCQDLQKVLKADPDATFLSLGDPDFSQACREGEQYRTCINNLYSGCGQAVPGGLVGIMDAFQYMCEDGRQTYLKHHQCFAGEELNSEGKVCVDNANATTIDVLSRFDSINNPTQTERNEALDGLCRASDDLKSCLRKVVSEHCGDEAAEFQLQVHSTVTRMAEILGGCSAASLPQLKWVYIGMAVAGALLL